MKIYFDELLVYLYEEFKSLKHANFQRNPPKKKQKLEKKSKTESAEDNSWSMGNKRFVKLTEFKGKWYVDIREFYENNGELKPGKRGIMLTMEQWQKFKGMVGEIDEAIKKNV